MVTKKTISVSKRTDRSLKEAEVVASLDLTPEQQEQVKSALGRSIKKLQLTRLELEMIVSPAGYDAPGAGVS